MKSFHFALVLTLLLAAGVPPALARPATHSGTSSSFKSGFSSQKSNSASRTPAMAPAPASPRGPGSFGRAAADGAAPPPRNGSALGRDMDQSAAQARALNTLDARRAAAAPPPSTPLPPLHDTPMRPQPPANQPTYAQPGYGGQAPIVVQQPSSGLMHGVVGFMLGRALSQPAYYPGNNGNGNSNSNSNSSGNAHNRPGGDWNDGNAVQGEVGSLNAGAVSTPVAPAPSLGASIVRLLAWLALLGGLAWLLVYMVGKWRRIKAASVTNYSFERN